MSLPEGHQRERYGHCSAAFTMCPGLTEVVVFGGKENILGSAISKTSVLQFGELLLLYTHVVNRATIFWTMCPYYTV